MAALTQNIVRDLNENIPPRFNTLEVADAVHIYSGAFLGDDGNGRIRPLVALDTFLGLSEQEVNMVTPASLAAGDLECRYRGQGEVVASVATVAGIGDVDQPVYALSDNDLTLVAAGATLIGKVRRWISGTICVVAFQGLGIQSV